MTIMQYLSTQDNAKAERVLAHYYDTKSLSDLLDEWAKIVDELEHVPVSTIFYILSDLEIRDVIEKVSQELSPEGRQVLQAAVRPIDERFTRATQEIPLQDSQSIDEPQSHWWWYRMPKQAGRRLATWLRSQAYINYLSNRRRLNEQIESLQLSPEDSAVVADMLARTTIRTLPRLLREWAKKVAEIEYHYEFGIEDYWNDLCVRDIIAAVLQKLSTAGQQVLMTVVGPVDERFLQATRPVPHPLWEIEPWQQWGFLPADPEGFWWYRVPKRRGEELTEWLRAKGWL